MIGYGETGFIIDRNGFCSGVYIKETVPHPGYACGTCEYGGQDIPVFDFNRYVKDFFGCTEGESGGISLVFGPVPGFGRIALKTNRHPKMERIALSEIRLIPSFLQKLLNKKGILGVRFPAKGIQYLLTLEEIICDSLH